jgi:hypothetical protein
MLITVKPRDRGKRIWLEMGPWPADWKSRPNYFLQILRYFIIEIKLSRVDLNCSQNVSRGFWRNFSNTREGFDRDPPPRVNNSGPWASSLVAIFPDRICRPTAAPRQLLCSPRGSLSHGALMTNSVVKNGGQCWCYLPQNGICLQQRDYLIILSNHLNTLPSFI